MNKKAIYGAIIVVLIAVVVAAGWQLTAGQKKAAVQPTPTPTVHPTASASTISQATTAGTPLKTLTYQGEDGKTALDLLKQHDPSVVTKGTGTNAYVTTIGGYTANDSKHEYWEMLVNGQASQVGAGSYVTKNGDTIEWKLATY